MSTTVKPTTNSSAINSNAARPKLSSYFTADPLSGDMIFQTPADFQAYALQRASEWAEESAKTARPCLFLYKHYVYDITAFCDAHPGGGDILHEYNGKDVTLTFHDEYNHHGHTTAALNMMLQYRAGRVLHSNAVKSSGGGAAQQEEEYELYKLEELTAYPKMTANELVYRDFTIRRDRGLVWQAMFLSLDQYFHLIETPIYVPNCRLFDTALLEPFSKTKYWVVAALWLPLSLFWTLRAVFKDYRESSPSILKPQHLLSNDNLLFNNYPYADTAIGANESAGAVAAAQLRQATDASKFSPVSVVFVFLWGVVLWTFTEYCLHRFLFHFERLVPRVVIDNPLAKLLHLCIHGLHHIIPMDPDRLVFPPVLFVIASFLIYNFFALFLGGSFLDLIAGGVVFGYVLYDEIHYFIHHVEPTDFYFKDLKKYHHAHHYVDDTTGFGISNKFWDIVFGTECKKN